MTIPFEKAYRNERQLYYIFSGYGHYRISCKFRGRTITTTTTNLEAVDCMKGWNSASTYGDMPCTRAERMEYRDAYNALVNECINNNIEWKGV